MDKIVAIITRVPKTLRYDDDAIDRLSHRYSVVVMVTFAVLSTMQQFVGKPITCWVPKEFTGSHTKYANSYCWVKNTYWLPFENYVPKAHEEEKRSEIIYYQWMPFVFLTMALFFYIPSQVWTSFNQKSGVDSDNIMEGSRTLLNSSNPEKREKSIRIITNQLDRILYNRNQLKTGCSVVFQRCLSSTLCCLCGQGFGNYLYSLFMFTKLLYIGNVFAQLFILNHLLRTNYNIYGFEVIDKLVNVPHEPEVFLNHSIFPKVTMCDFNIRRLGNVHRYTVQCLLPINLYTEKMFIFAWFWMVIVLFFSVLSFLQWFMRAICADDRHNYIRSHLESTKRIEDDTDRALCFDFVQEYLRHDGVFLFRLIGHNTNMITVNDILGSLWDHWNDNRPTPRKNYPINGGRPKGSPPPPPPKPGLFHRFNPLRPTAPNIDEPDGVLYKPTTEEDVC